VEIEFLIASLVAGILTSLAPCIVPVLPIILGGSAGHKSFKKPLIIIGSLAVSIVLFTLLVRASANAFNISQGTLTNISGGILIAFGIFTIFPEVWDKISLKLNLNSNSNKLMARFSQKGGIVGDSLLGASLGPVFTSCSPTYAAILALVLSGEISYGVATVYLAVYALGLSLILLLIAFAGQKAVKKLGWATNPHGWFKRIVGIAFLLIGLAIITGIDKEIETWLLEQGFYEPFAEFENNIRE
jgi:cytochrome c-type biogenesis protein